VACCGKRLGLVNLRRQQATPAGHCWESALRFSRMPRSRGHGTKAHRLLARYLFAHTTVHRSVCPRMNVVFKLLVSHPLAGWFGVGH